MKQRIQVTEEDIQETVQGDPQACMVWRAVTRNLQLESGTGSEPVVVHVGYDAIDFLDRDGRKHVRAPLNNWVNGQIRKFDRDRGAVKPFSFELDLPDDWRQQVTGMSEGGAK